MAWSWTKHTFKFGILVPNYKGCEARVSKNAKNIIPKLFFEILKRLKVVKVTLDGEIKRFYELDILPTH